MSFLVCPRLSPPFFCKPVFQWNNILGRWSTKVHLCHIKNLYCCPCCSLLSTHLTPTICFSTNKLCWNFKNFCSKIVIYFKSTYFLHLFPPGPVHYDYSPYRTNLHHGWLSVPVSNFHVYYLALWLHVFSLVSPLLVPRLHEGTKTAKNGEKWHQQRSVKQILVSKTKEVYMSMGKLALLDNQDI